MTRTLLYENSSVVFILLLGLILLTETQRSINATGLIDTEMKVFRSTKDM